MNGQLGCKNNGFHKIVLEAERLLVRGGYNDSSHLR